MAKSPLSARNQLPGTIEEIAQATLIDDVGFDPVDDGPLRVARYAEPFTVLVAVLAYERRGGPELAYRFERS